jgi:hypothetical protein
MTFAHDILTARLAGELKEDPFKPQDGRHFAPLHEIQFGPDGVWLVFKDALGPGLVMHELQGTGFEQLKKLDGMSVHLQGIPLFLELKIS